MAKVWLNFTVIASQYVSTGQRVCGTNRRSLLALLATSMVCLVSLSLLVLLRAASVPYCQRRLLR